MRSEGQSEIRRCGKDFIGHWSDFGFVWSEISSHRGILSSKVTML